MYIVALTRASAIDEIADAMHARLTTDFGADTCDPSHLRCLQLSMPLKLSEAEARALNQRARDVRHVRAPAFERFHLRQGFVFLEGGTLEAVKKSIADDLGGFARRMTFVATPHISITRIIRKEACASAEALAKSIGIPDPIYFSRVELMRREYGTHRLVPYDDMAQAA